MLSVITAYAAGEVVASDCDEYKEGHLVAGMLGWEDYTLFRPSPGVLISKIDAAGDGFPLSHHMSALGTSGMTAYAGLFELGKPAKGEKVFVSAASGSVGSLVGQFAKLAGCYVVGCAGTQAKVLAPTTSYFPDGIDIYYENVGGEMLEAALANMNTYGRVAVSGVMSEYTGSGRRAVPNMEQVIYKRITIRGFLAWDFLAKFHEFNAVIGDWIRQGKVQVLEDVSDGLDSVPSAFAALFRGENIGKKLVKLA
ncbi:hypothetical protein PR202_ga15011 [Eleusine coracana subsp. coracana]|uniref:Uncharacterized protein n=1 Tax=Eleusine coracana subsp. coracana TaxID=191504 RepID=A0AAV5CIW7_ELECO|nr:hypothetical protein PR202_ga15011 [Eleusine coracana subsp. coracana]